MQPSRGTSTLRLRGRVLIVCLVILTATAAAATVRAQDDGVKPERGFTPAGSYALSDIESIDLSGGNMMLNIPLATLPAGRGGSPGFRLGLRYNSKLFNSFMQVERYSTTTRNVEKQYLGDAPHGGWDYSLHYSLELHNRLNNYPAPEIIPQPGSPEYIYRYKLFVHFPDGSTREFSPRASVSHLNGFYSVAPTDGAVYYSTDGSYIRLQFGSDGDANWQNNTWTLSFPDGGRVASDGRRYDRNGNYTAVTGVTLANGHPATKIADQLGRAIYIEYDPTVHPDGRRHDYVFMSGFGNEELRWTVKWKEVHVYKTFYADARGGNLYPNQWRGPWEVVAQIVLPAQAGALSYAFGYNAPEADPYPNNSHGWGEINSVTLPSGARTTYTYLRDGVHALNWKRALENHVVTKTLTYLEEYDGSSTQASQTWTYGLLPAGSSLPSHGPGRVQNPDGGIASESYDRTLNSPYFGKPLATGHPDGTVVERHWRQNLSPWMSGRAVNPYVKTEFKSIRDAAGNPVKTAIKDYDYDRNGNLLRVAEYDWVAYGDVERDATTGRPTGTIPNAAPLRRVTTNTYYNPTPSATDTVTEDTDTYHYASAPPLRSALSTSEVGDGGLTLSRTEFYYDDPSATGNLITQKSWDSSKGTYSAPLTASNSVSVTHQYDSYGNPVLSTDARGIQTKLTYDPINGQAGLYPTKTEVAFGTPVKRTTTTQYDFWTGAVTLATDADNGVSTATTYDAFGRPKLVSEANGTPAEQQTFTEYSDAARRVIVRADLDAAGDRKLVSVQYYDQLGRVRLKRQLENATQNATNEAHGIKVQTRRAISGGYSYVLTSQPYRAATSGGTGEPTRGWTRTKADAGGRVIEAQTFEGAGLPAPWGSNETSTGTVITAYDAEFTTVTDQAGKVRRSRTDALARLIRVDEPDAAGSLGTTAAPAQPTSYAYDALGNLRKVDQGGQLRFFMYDSFSRLVRAKNPEQGVTTHAEAPALADPVTGNTQWSLAYAYDAGGNLIRRIDARNVKTTYTYEALGRNTAVDYSDGTPDVKRTFDGATGGKGRPWHNYSGGDETTGAVVQDTVVDSYDELGRPLAQRQRFKAGGAWVGSYQSQRTFDRAGNVLTQTYPSGRSVTYDYDAAGRLSDFRGTLGDGASRVYATGVAYDEQGRMRQEQFGTQTPLYNKRFYNSLGQLAEIRLGTYHATDAGWWNRGAILNVYSPTASWTESGAQNNGNLRKQMIFVPNGDDPNTQGWWQTNFYYEYDSLNRLDRVREVQNDQNLWMQDYDYDRWGNRTINTANTQVYGTPGYSVPEPQFDKGDLQHTNRLYAPGDLALAVAQRKMQYDAAGNLTKDTHTGEGTRTYDAENRMTQAQFVSGQAQTAAYTYDADGRRVKRNIGAGGEVWQVYGFGGEPLAEYAPGTAPARPFREYGYRAGELLVTADAPQPVNVALATNGAAAAASSTLDAGRAASGAINGDRKGLHWGTDPATGSGWHDATNGAYPDWLEVSFQGSKTINEVDVFTLQDNYTNPAEPTEAMTFMQYGLDDFRVEYWDGAAWSLVPALAGSSATAVDNRKVWWRVQFAPVTTSKIRVVVTSGLAGHSRIVEVEAYQAGGSGADVRWLVSDHLGTPRMVVNQTGSLAGVTRRDYLPFGEEMVAGMGGRTAGRGYSPADGVRQKFTQKERDEETGLDFFGARFYTSAQGRFISCDPLMITVRHFKNPQRWNTYAYVLNSPLSAYDPNGQDGKGEGGGRVIDIFIVINRSEIGNRGMAWRDLEKIAERHNNKVAIYSRDAGTVNGAKMGASLATKGRYVIDFGHSLADSDTMPNGRVIGREGVLADDLPAPDGHADMLGVDQRGDFGMWVDGQRQDLSINAAAFMVFTCYPGASFESGVTRNMNQGAFFSYNDGGGGAAGKGAVSTAQVMERAAYAAAMVLAKNGTPEDAAAAAQKVLNASLDPQDQGDSLITIRVGVSRERLAERSNQ